MKSLGFEIRRSQTYADRSHVFRMGTIVRRFREGAVCMIVSWTS
jgi:hypothetical protein